MLLFVKLFFIAAAFLLFFYIAGAIVIRLFRIVHKEQFFVLFLSLVLGLSAIVSLYAIICTRGNTIQAAILVLITLVAWAIRYKPVDDFSPVAVPVAPSRTGVGVLPILLGLVIIIFCVQYFILYDLDSEYLKTPFVDYVYYSRLSLPLNNLGLETNDLESIYQQLLTQQPYHYAEIWLNALLVRITGLPSAWLFFISSSAILLTIVCVGFCALFAHFQLRAIWVIILALLFLFVTGIRWSFLQHSDFVANGALLSSSLLCLHPKLAPVYIVVLLVVLLLLNRHYVAAGAALAIMPLAFISTAPVAGVGAVAVAGYLLLTRQLSVVRAVAMVMPMIAATLYIILFYALHPEPCPFSAIGRAFALQSIIPKLSEIGTLLNITIGVFINYIIYFGAYGALLLLLRRQLTFLTSVPSVVWVWFGVSLVMAAMMRAFGTHYLDSFQFFSNIMLPLTPVVLAVAVAVVLQRVSSISCFLVTAILALLSIFNFLVMDTGITRYSPQFLRKISRAVPLMGYRGAYILADTEYKNAYMLSSDSYTAGNYISSFMNDYALISLSEPNVNIVTTDERFARDSAQAKQIIEKSTLYRFDKFQSLKGHEYSLDSIQYKFVTENNIGFICASKEAKLPLVLQPLVLAAYADSLSGERFYLLNHKQKGVASSAYN